MSSRKAIALSDVAVPFAAVGAGAFAVSSLNAGETPSLFLLPTLLAVVLGFARPSFGGSVGAILGWALGVRLGSSIGEGEASLAGLAAYGLIVAAVPHTAGVGIRVLARLPLRPPA